MGTIYIIGAGLAGLSCAVRCVDQGAKVVVFEAAKFAGGRCRSFHDEHLDRVIDNGTHLILSANKEVMSYAKAIGSSDQLIQIKPANFPFHDLSSGADWTIKPGLRALAGGVPGMGPGDVMDALKLTRAKPGKTVAQVVNTNAALYEKLLRPFCVSVLNAQPEEAEASLLGAVLGKTLLKGEKGSRAVVATKGLAAALIDPAINHLKHRNCPVSFDKRIITVADGQININKSKAIPLNDDDRVIIATPPWVSPQIAPEMTHPTAHKPIVNVHFRLDKAPSLSPPYLGLIGGSSQWLSIRDDVVSVTVSDATSFSTLDSNVVAEIVWKEIRKLVGFPDKYPEEMPPPFRVIKEKRATFSQTPDQVSLRPGPQTIHPNIFLAGDWTDTGLPCTIEGAVLSGHRAAVLALK